MDRNKYKMVKSKEFYRPISVGNFSSAAEKQPKQSMKNQLYFKRYGTDEKITQFDQKDHKVILEIPVPGQSVEKEKLSFLHSRQNIQHMNKKYRSIRNSRFSTSLGLGNNRETKMIRPKSSYPTQSMNQFTPMIIKMKTQRNSRTNSKSRCSFKEKKGNENSKEYTQPKIDQRDIFVPEIQSETGLILHRFQNHLGKKNMQDNLHVMASVLRKKVKHMEKNEVVKYIQKLMRKNH